MERAADVVKYLLAGADVVQCASALLRNGPEYAGVLLAGVRNWMSHKGYEALPQTRGPLAASDTEDRRARERADYVRTLQEADTGGEYVSGDV